MNDKTPKKTSGARGKQQKKVPESSSSNGSAVTYILIGIVVVLVLAAAFGIYQFINIKSERDEVLQHNTEMNEYVIEVSDTMNDISETLGQVREKQVRVTNLIQAGETSDSKYDSLMKDINAISAQLEQDKQEINQLEEQLSGYQVRITELERMVTNLRKEIEEKEQTIKYLQSIIEHKDEIIAEARAELQRQQANLQQSRTNLSQAQTNLNERQQDLQEAEEELEEVQHTVYWIADFSENLVDAGIVEEHGLFRKTYTLKPGFDESKFSSMNKANANMFTVPGVDADDVVLVPSRNEASYIIEQSGDNAVIRVMNNDEFWKVEHLVIVVK